MLPAGAYLQTKKGRVLFEHSLCVLVIKKGCAVFTTQPVSACYKNGRKPTINKIYATTSL